MALALGLYSTSLPSGDSSKMALGAYSIIRLEVDSAFSRIYGRHISTSALPCSTAMALSRQVGYPQAPQLSRSSGTVLPVRAKTAAISSSVGWAARRRAGLCWVFSSTSTCSVRGGGVSVLRRAAASSRSFITSSGVLPGTPGPWTQEPSQALISRK